MLSLHCARNFDVIAVIHNPIFIFIFLQAMYAYMKAAYLSMLSTGDYESLGMSDVALFR